MQQWSFHSCPQNRDLISSNRPEFTRSAVRFQNVQFNLTFALMNMASGVRLPCTSPALSCKNSSPFPTCKSPFCISNSSISISLRLLPFPSGPSTTYRLDLPPTPAALPCSSFSRSSPDRDAVTSSVANWIPPLRVSSTGSTNSNMLGCRNRAKELASLLSRSSTSSCTRFNDVALFLPLKPPLCGSSDFLSNTNTDAALPVVLFVASKIRHAPAVEEG